MMQRQQLSYLHQQQQVVTTKISDNEDNNFHIKKFHGNESLKMYNFNKGGQNHSF